MYITPQALATGLSVHFRTVYRWINKGKIKAVKVGRAWRINKTEAAQIYKNGLYIESKQDKA
jgi:excisionase family DNA binding protein